VSENSIQEEHTKLNIPIENTSSTDNNTREGYPFEISIKDAETVPIKAVSSLSVQSEKIIQPIHEGQTSTVWNIIGASVQGTSHIKASIPCQDYHDYQVIADQTVIAAVADGLGSASKSHEGSRIAVDTVLTIITERLKQNQPANKSSWQEIIKTAFSQAKSELEKCAQAANCPVREFGTTLSVIVIGTDWLATGHIGDGAAVVLFEDGNLETICPPQTGEYVNQTNPLTAVNALEIAQFSVQIKKIQAVALFSDGVRHLSINNQNHTPYSPFFNGINLKTKAEFCSVSIWEFRLSSASSPL